jgi:hypothetical protein
VDVDVAEIVAPRDVEQGVLVARFNDLLAPDQTVAVLRERKRRRACGMREQRRRQRRRVKCF